QLHASGTGEWFGKRNRSETDVYSLGAMLYSLLTGRPPFQAANPMDTLRQVVEQEPIPVCKLNSNVPKELETISLKCLQKSPTERYESAGELSGELGRYLKGEPIKSRPVSTFERLIKYSKRFPLTNALLCIITMIISVLLFPLATLDSQVLDAYQDALSSSAPWFFIIGFVLGIWVIQDLAIWLGFKTFRSLSASSKEGSRSRLAAADVIWRAVWVVAIAFPLLCVLVLIVQLIRYARGDVL
ncbi:MAG: protein kinase, partial [Planctomycetales bacterium]|nr:protein kinase [Planctomycetales bacterium]